MEMMLLHTIKNDFSIIEFKEGYIKIQEIENKDVNKQDIRTRLCSITGLNWTIESDNSKEGINYGKQENEDLEKRKAKVVNHELVQKILKSFSEIEIDDIKLSNIDNK
jgi:hypothetical protein